MVGNERTPTVERTVIGEQKQPGFEGSFASVELPYRTEDIDEDLLNAVFCLCVITQDTAGYAKDNATVTFEQDGEGIGITVE